ncbi:MAG: hypothetical protein KDE19_24455 [Caldilineaceae bacterium]|nr:hypothetical protein [Caldilineaceae bacterium]
MGRTYRIPSLGAVFAGYARVEEGVAAARFTAGRANHPRLSSRPSA